MEFALSEEQELLAETTRRFVADQVPLDKVRAVADAGPASADDIWQGIVDLGLTGIMVPEAQGGSGLGLLEAALVAEALGGGVVPAPYVATAIMAPVAILEGASDDQAAEWLPKIADGSMKIGIAAQHVTGAREGAGITAEGDVLSGTSHFVMDADQADAFVVATNDSLFLVDKDAAGLSRTDLRTIDKTRTVATLNFERVQAVRFDGGNRTAAAVQKMIDAGRVALAADALGAADEMIRQAVEYSKQREQFGRVIGSFQAVKHMCAEMAATLEPCRSLVWYAAYAHNEVEDDAHVMACHAKAHLAEATRFVARTATEVHGGMGFTDLLGLHYWFKRIGFDRQVLGSPEQCREEAAKAQGWAA